MKASGLNVPFWVFGEEKPSEVDAVLYGFLASDLVYDAYVSSFEEPSNILYNKQSVFQDRKLILDNSPFCWTMPIEFIITTLVTIAMFIGTMYERQPRDCGNPDTMIT